MIIEKSPQTTKIKAPDEHTLLRVDSALQLVVRDTRDTNNTQFISCLKASRFSRPSILNICYIIIVICSYVEDVHNLFSIFYFIESADSSSRLVEKTGQRNCEASKKKQRVYHTNPGFCLPSLKSAWDLVYLGKLNVREILGNLIGCLEDWEI